MQEILQEIFFLGCFAFLTNAAAYKLGFFNLPSYSRPPVELVHLLSVFGIYLGFLFILPIFLIKVIAPSSFNALMTLQFVIVVCMVVTLFLYVRTEGRRALPITLKNPESSTSRATDFIVGVFVWLVAFPWTSIVGQMGDFLLESFFNFKSYEQVAVRYLKENLQSGPQLVLALISIVLIAPIVEEFLFRGILQQYLKKFLSSKSSITLTAAIFACFHFSASQGLGNFSLIPSLFMFACFLGYTYERQGSLFASIGLHFTFNCISSLQILFFSEI